MSTPEPSFSVNVDVTNPGQFFACCGLLELAHRLWAGAEGWFSNGRFLLLSHNGPDVPPVDLLKPLLDCDVELVSEGTPDSKNAPLELGPPISTRLDWWLNDDGRPNLFKTWAANATSKQMFCKWRDPLKQSMRTLTDDPGAMLQVNTRLQGSYGFDSELGWDALTVGFSLNEHAGLKELPTRPVVELVGAIGLQRFFPILNRKQREVSYSTWGAPLLAPVARVAAIGQIQITGRRRLRTRFVSRGSLKGLDTATVIQGGADE
jgi:CRISPR-associated protein Csx14